MKILFSECTPDYSHYIFPYAIWAIPDEGERPSQIFARGFLPGARDLSRFYMCRHLRVRLEQFALSSENRRILRKCAGISFRLVPREEFPYNEDWREFCKTYADIKWGKDIMTYERLDSLFQSPIVNHLLVYRDDSNGQEVGIVTLYLEPPEMGYYYYAFYDLNYYPRNLGMYMMTTAVDHFAREGYRFLYLGTCYSRNALYKTQFSGTEFWTGFRWSSDLAELKFMLERGLRVQDQHLLESEEYLARFYGGCLGEVLRKSQLAAAGPASGAE
jgi:arginyl-tRNA--protein-N-Asp/Glu arginylyltransferase